MLKEITVLVGGNGSGKSTFYERQLKARGLPFLNADNLAADKWPDNPEAHSYEAAREIEALRTTYLAAGQSFCFETVFSHKSKVDFLAQAFSQGYQVHLVVIHINDAGDTNVARVANRAKNGGHSVPEDKIRQRIPRMLENVNKAIPFCHSVSFYDNSFSSKGFVPLAVLDKKNGILSAFQELPLWVTNCVQDQYDTFTKVPEKS